MEDVGKKEKKRKEYVNPKTQTKKKKNQILGILGSIEKRGQQCEKKGK